MIKQKHKDKVGCYVVNTNNINMKMTLIIGLTPSFSLFVDISFYIPTQSYVFLQNDIKEI